MEGRHVLMKIIKGKIPSAKKIVVYGPEGIGKSTFAAQFPDPVFIDTEGSTKDMDVARFEKPSSWQMLMDQIRYFIQHPETGKTLVIDTIDWAEQMCIEDLCARHGKKGIEDFGYGNGYVYAKEEFGRFLNLLGDLVERGIHIVLTAHAQIRKFEQPDESGAYDRYELKLGKKTSSQTSPLVKEWADMVLFANYKTYSIAQDDKGKKYKAQGGKRVMYTSHHPCWDAKNRYGLPEELDFEFSTISGIFGSQASQEMKEVQKQAITSPAQNTSKQETNNEKTTNLQQVTNDSIEQHKVAKTNLTQDIKDANQNVPKVDESIPKALRDLMIQNQVHEWDIQEVVAARGYYPNDVPIYGYDQEFINGVLVGAWDQVFEMIKEMKEKSGLVFK